MNSRFIRSAAGISFVVASACSSETSDTPASAPVEYTAMVRGKLASTDLAVAKAAHDAIAKAGEASSKAAGNFGHQPHLGTTLLDSTPNEFLSIDRWSDGKAMEAFYSDPKIKDAFGSLFAGPPTIQFFVHAPAWASWGDLRSAKGSAPWSNHLALGVLKDSDPEKNHQAHDAVASNGKTPSMQAGNVAHVVFLGLHDSRQFVAFDLWPKSDNIQAFYTNPQFAAAFAPLFESVSQPVFQSTDWHSW
jgi:quinol monooxygenase YgiN